MLVNLKIIIVTCTPEVFYTCLRLSILCYVMVRMGESMVNVCLPEDNHSYMYSRILYPCHPLSILCYVMFRKEESMG